MSSSFRFGPIHPIALLFVCGAWAGCDGKSGLQPTIWGPLHRDSHHLVKSGSFDPNHGWETGQDVNLPELFTRDGEFGVITNRGIFSFDLRGNRTRFQDIDLHFWEKIFATPDGFVRLCEGNGADSSSVSFLDRNGKVLARHHENHPGFMDDSFFEFGAFLKGGDFATAQPVGKVFLMGRDATVKVHDESIERNWVNYPAYPEVFGLAALPVSGGFVVDADNGVYFYTSEAKLVRHVDLPYVRAKVHDQGQMFPPQVSADGTVMIGRIRPPAEIADGYWKPPYQEDIFLFSEDGVEKNHLFFDHSWGVPKMLKSGTLAVGGEDGVLHLMNQDGSENASAKLPHLEEIHKSEYVMEPQGPKVSAELSDGSLAVTYGSLLYILDPDGSQKALYQAPDKDADGRGLYLERVVEGPQGALMVEVKKDAVKTYPPAWGSDHPIERRYQRLWNVYFLQLTPDL